MLLRKANHMKPVDQILLWASLDGMICTIACRGKENAEWVRSTWLPEQFPTIQKGELKTGEQRNQFQFTVTCSDQIAPWQLQTALIDCARFNVRKLFPVKIIDRPHYRLKSVDLADWIDNQGEEIWWSVDGDWVLMGLLNLPCPPEELSAELRKINKMLIVLDPKDSGWGQEIGLDDIPDLIELDPAGNRQLLLAWVDRGEDWLLVEDEALVAN